MDKLYEMKHAPVDVEILAYHKQGGNFHPIKIDSLGRASMRWHDEYGQHKNHFSGWVYMPNIDDLINKGG